MKIFIYKLGYLTDMKMTPKQAYNKYLNGSTSLSSKQLKLALDWRINDEIYKYELDSDRQEAIESLQLAIKRQEEKEKQGCPHFKNP